MKQQLTQKQLEGYAHAYMSECRDAARNAVTSATEERHNPFFVSVEDCVARAEVAYSHGKRYFVADKLAAESARGYRDAARRVGRLHAAGDEIPEGILDI